MAPAAHRPVPPDPRVAAVIVTFNRRDAVGITLDRLRELPVDEVVVVDNASEDGTAGAVRARGDVRVIEAGANLGFGARNVGAREADADLLLFVDDDAYPLPGTVEHLVAAFRRRPDLGVAGGLVRDLGPGGNVVRSTELGTFDWWLRSGRSGDGRDGLPAFFFPDGACMARRDAFLEAGGYYEPFFLSDMDGLDLATRLLARGWDVRYYPQARFDHRKLPSGRQVNTPGRRLELRIRNELWYFWRHFPQPLAALRMSGYMAYELVECVYRRSPGAWARGIAGAWRGRDTVRPDRRPLPRAILRRAELHRGRAHARLLAGQVGRRLRPAAGETTRPPLVLTYHGFGTRTAEQDPHNLFVPVEDFAAQMDHVARHLRPIGLDAYLAGVERGRWPKRSVLVTMDDGMVSALEEAAPILARHHVPAVAFVPPACLGGTTRWMPEMPDERLVGPGQLAALERFGIDVGAHGLDHRLLPGLDAAELHRQVAGARDALAGLIRRPPAAFAYPDGAFDPAAMEAVRRAGYFAAFSVGRDAGRYAIERMTVDARDSLRTFVLKTRRPVRWLIRVSEGHRVIRRLGARVAGQRPGPSWGPPGDR